MTNAHVIELIAFTIDCSDATRLARFYADLTGGEVTGDYPEYGAAQTTTLGVTLNFQGVKGYAAPAWPGQQHPQQYHLDFRVPDLEKATEHAIGLGATQAGEQPNEELWRVMIDPDGHPFCPSVAVMRCRARVQVETADRAGPGPEGEIAGAVQPAADLVRPDPGLGQDPAHDGPGHRQAAFAQVTGDRALRPA
jgi:hypothetical protein